jgi:hypothetical protein
MIKILTLPLDRAEELFTCGDDGENVTATAAAALLVLQELQLEPPAYIKWHLPDVFDIRYGSSYVGTATVGEKSLRIVTDEGDWQDGDDKGFKQS